MRKRLGRVVSIAVLCAAVLGTAAWSQEREAPKGKPIAKPQQEEKQQRQVVHHRVGKWKVVRNAEAKASGMINDCAAICDDEICVCVEDIWDDGCCDLACDICWFIIDMT
jgi:hypothetical protein